MNRTCLFLHHAQTETWRGLETGVLDGWCSHYSLLLLLGERGGIADAQPCPSGIAGGRRPCWLGEVALSQVRRRSQAWRARTVPSSQKAVRGEEECRRRARFFFSPLFPIAAAAVGFKHQSPPSFCVSQIGEE